jgi:hypothetical protein
LTVRARLCQPGLPEGRESSVADKKSERDERLAKALRENLKRRKAHAREADKPVVPAKAGNSGREDDGN